MVYNFPILSNKEFLYEGYFEFRKIYPFINNYFENERNYDNTIEKTEEKNLEDGEMYYYIKFVEENEYNDFLNGHMKFTLILDGIEEIVEINDEKKRLMKGKLKLKLSKIIIDKEVHSEKSRTNFSWFLKDINKYYFKNDEIEDFTKILKKDWKDLKIELKRFLGTYENILGDSEK